MHSSQFRLVTGIVATLLVLALIGVGLLTLRSYPLATPTPLPGGQAAAALPALQPTLTTTVLPTLAPASAPTAAVPLTPLPIAAPTDPPADAPTATPTAEPTNAPTDTPTDTPTPTETPAEEPDAAATDTPTGEASATLAATATRAEIAIEEIRGVATATLAATPTVAPAGGAAVIQLTVEFVGATPTEPPSPTPTPYVAELPLPTPDPDATPAAEPQLFSNANYITGLAFAGEALWAATQGGAVTWNPRSGDAVKFTTADGLTANALTAVVNCAAPGLGIVFGSDTGLQLFDTRTASWRTLPAGGDGPHFDDVTALACDARTGTLVVGYAAHGLDIYNSRTQAWTLRDEEALVAAPMTDVAILPDGTIWAAAGPTLAQLQGDDLTLFDSDNSPLSGEPIGALTLDGEGAPWLVSGDRLLHRSADEWTTYDAASVTGSFPAGTLTAVQSPRNGAIWVGSDQGDVCRFEPEAGNCAPFFRNQGGMARGPVTALAATATGTAAFGTHAEGISHFDRERWQPLLLQGETAAGNRVAALAADAAGFIWAATDGSVQQMNPAFPAANWIWTTENSDLGATNVRALFADERGGVWLGGDGASYFDGATWSTLTVEDGLVAPEVTAIVEDDQGRIWLGTRAGLSVWNGEDFFNLTRESGLPSDEITALAAPRNAVWIGTNGGGLYRFRDNQLQVFTAENAGLPSDVITALAVVPGGELLVGTDAGLARMVDGEVLPEAEITAHVTSLSVGPQETLWVGTAGDGVAAFDGNAWRWLDEADGLPGSHIAAVAIDLYGAPWFGGASGGFVRGVAQATAD